MLLISGNALTNASASMASWPNPAASKDLDAVLLGGVRHPFPGLFGCFYSHHLGRALQGRKRRCGERGGLDWRAPNGSWCNAVVDLLDRADIEARQIVTNPKKLETLHRLSRNVA